MKTFLIIVAVLIALFALIQLYITISTNKTKSQPYKVISKQDDFEIRFYPAATLASISSSAKSYKELGNSGFRTLAGYIFGGNKENKQIAMTSPVQMDITDTGSSMSFVMPEAYDESNLPTPKDAKVNIHKTNDEYVVALQFGGFASDHEINRQIGVLKTLLKVNNIKAIGNYKYFGYNPPYQLFGRRNEVIVAIDWQN